MTPENEYIPLSEKQRKFLQYLKNEHNSLGYERSIKWMLSNGEYKKRVINLILKDWIELLDMDLSSYNDRTYGVPKKYKNTKNIKKHFNGK